MKNKDYMETPKYLLPASPFMCFCCNVYDEIYEKDFQRQCIIAAILIVIKINLVMIFAIMDCTECEL